MKAFFARLWNWIRTDGKTTMVALVYTMYETMILMPDIHTIETPDLLKRVARVAVITLIGILARDRKPQPILPPADEKPNEQA